MQTFDFNSRWSQQRCKRPIRIANRSEAQSDPRHRMLRHGILGDVEFITGDYIAGQEDETSSYVQHY